MFEWLYPLFYPVDKMSQLILILNTTCVCEGNSDDSFTSLSTLRQGTMMDQSSEQIIVFFPN